MMEALNTIVLGIRVPQDSFRRVELQAVNLEGNVEQVRAEAIRETGLANDQLLLVYAGVALDDRHTLKSYGINPGVMIHVMKKKEKDIPPPHKIITDKEIQQLALAFRTVALNASFRSTLNRLSRPEMLENIIMATPGLSQDPVAIAIIRDPELLVHMGDVATIRKVVEKHPALAEAATHIAAAVHEETITARHSRRGEATPASSSSAFSLDAFSGGEEMDSSQSSDSPTTRPGFGITSSQLAAALAAVGTPAGGASTSGASGSRPAVTDPSMLITSEMFNSALQQAFQGISMPVPGDSPTSAVAPPQRNVATDQGPFMMAERMSQQLQQMRELGLRDQVFNLQALQITNGDVQAAIELVMSSGAGGANDDDDENYN